jgi:tetratricopeptide (TPR) repeat protein
VTYLLGGWQESRAAFETSVAMSQTFGGTFGQVLGLQHLVLLDMGVGRYDAAGDRLQEALALVHASDNALVRMHSRTRLYGTLARNCLDVGDLAGAADAVARGFAAQQEAGECASCDVLLYPAAVPTYLALGDLQQAEHAARKAEEVASAFRSNVWVANARYLSGLVASERGDWQLAADAFADALAVFEALEQPFDVARTLETMATLATKAEPALPALDAQDLGARAAAIYAQLGAHHAVARVSGG